MNHPPGTIPAPSTNSHPRRPPAHKSVSLRHSPSSGLASKATGYHAQATDLSSPNVPASDKANPPSTVSPRITHKQSSGESSDAGKWFENTNNNAVQSSASFVDNDPPFFLRNSSSSGTPPEGQDVRSIPLRPQSTPMPYRPGLTRFNTEGSSVDDFRSVIDDLTVANKKLKQKLRKYEKLYDAHLQDEKLFEVRFHGLPDHKKKELEETLRKFASDLDTTAATENPALAHPPQLDQQKTASSMASRFAESGYVSMSASGQNSSSAHNSIATPSGHNNDRPMSKSQYNRQQQSVRSYLQDIPFGLFPKHTAPMTEKSKKKLVVRRLEQIFAGKRSVPGTHSQPIQQEEVAQSAAMADRQAREATGQLYRKEGLREARIMPVRSEDEEIAPHAAESLQKSRPSLAIQEQDFAGSGSPDQRPTRPLDLDPYRAQVPAENMEYIRHLGFTPPDMESEAAPEDDHGWIYLNLLINMAQLHTINVTPDFVKDAVTEYSSKFELSHDGRKIRWKGGYDETRISDSSSEQYSGGSPYDTQADSSSISPPKRLKTGHIGGSGESHSEDPKRQARRIVRMQKEHDQNKFAYTPIFFHKEESDADDDYFNIDMSSSNSPFMAQKQGDSSGFGSSAMRSSSSRKRRQDGPIIFYNKAKFCTDLSGDRRGLSLINPTSYESISAQPLGATSGPIGLPSFVSDIAEPRGPLDSVQMDLDPKETRATSSEEEIGFSPEALRSDTGDDSPDVVEFEASGLGGVQPDDNFSIKVKRSQVRVGSSSTGRYKTKKPQFYPKKILQVLREQQTIEDQDDTKTPRPPIKEKILSASRRSLPSSTLPPASFLPFDSTSSGDVDSDLESDVSSGPSTASSSDRDPVTEIRLLNVSPTYTGANRNTSTVQEVGEDESNESSDELSDSDGSVDFLATARRLDPSTIRASEREHGGELADRLAEEIPAGSSAATAGGASGFNSPADKHEGGDDADTTKRPSNASGSASTRTNNLKRTRTSESMRTSLQPGKTQKTN